MDGASRKRKLGMAINSNGDCLKITRAMVFRKWDTWRYVKKNEQRVSGQRKPSTKAVDESGGERRKTGQECGYPAWGDRPAGLVAGRRLGGLPLCGGSLCGAGRTLRTVGWSVAVAGRLLNEACDTKKMDWPKCDLVQNEEGLRIILAPSGTKVRLDETSRKGFALGVASWGWPARVGCSLLSS
jgi:hypothetical protein